MNVSSTYVIGIDGGGTKTAVQLTDLQGIVLAEAKGGPSNFQNVGIEQAAKTILDLIETCCHSVGCNISAIGSIVAGLAGAGRPTDQQRMADGLMHEAGVRNMKMPHVAIESDARIALEGAFEGLPGIIAIAGTGAIVYGKDSKGAFHRTSGWGLRIGDKPSGYEIGREGIRAVGCMIDGSGPKTLIAAYLKKEFQLGTQEEIIKAVYKDVFDLATVAPLVLRAAQKNDKVALRILEGAADELVGSIRAVVKQMNSSSKRRIPLSLIGSLVTGENAYVKKIHALVKREIPLISIQKPFGGPLQGAILMAIASNPS